ncbi:MAG: DUF362 domain-containing protein [Planctomycetota bacterium]
MTDEQNTCQECKSGLPDTHAWTRRDLLVRGGQAVVVGGLLGGAALYLHDPEGDAGLQDVKPVRLKDYFAKVAFPDTSPRISVAYGGMDDVEKMVGAAVGGIDPLGIKRFIAQGDVVLLKPNVGFDRNWKLGATTNPEVVRSVIRLCREAGAGKIIVADNPIENPAACFIRSGVEAAARDEGADVYLHSSAQDVPVVVRDAKPDTSKGEILQTWPIFWKPLSEADKVIGIPVIKDHNLCSASMGMKNWYGLLGGRRNQFHQAIHHIISDLGYMMKPTLMIADGTRVMMTNGPTGGRLDDIKIGGIAGRPVVVASVDQLACDSWCYENLLGRDPASLAYLDLAYKKFGDDPSRRVARHWQDYKRLGMIAETRL